MMLIALYSFGLFVAFFIGWRQGIKFGAHYSLLGIRKVIIDHRLDNCPACQSLITFDLKWQVRELTIKEYGKVAEKIGIS